ncbi:hypothetical protein EBAPG3_005070 [Nitrosospira lacus]|uniref:Uncharacterized protein n=1 Tax=Nitrosospira lacus TaxID=1288494 RepID=A0A1W6SN45_9PROT|nr:hypothetical protein EBAPG3_005070 [Nitrosospira lacus]
MQPYKFKVPNGFTYGMKQTRKTILGDTTTGIGHPAPDPALGSLLMQKVFVNHGTNLENERSTDGFRFIVMLFRTCYPVKPLDSDD